MLSQLNKFTPFLLLWSCVLLSCKTQNRVAHQELEVELDVIAEEAIETEEYMFGNDDEGDSVLIRLNQEVEKDTANYKLYLNRAYYFEENDDFENALADYDRAIELKPDEKSAYFDRAILKSNNYRLEEAYNDYQLILSLWPNDADAFNNIGGIAMDLANRNQIYALEFLRNYFDFKGSIKFVEQNHATATMNEPLKLAVYTTAILYYDKAIKVNPEHRFAYGNKALALYYMGEVEEACAIWNIALKFDDPSAGNYIESICNELKE